MLQATGLLVEYSAYFSTCLHNRHVFVENNEQIPTTQHQHPCPNDQWKPVLTLPQKTRHTAWPDKAYHRDKLYSNPAAWRLLGSLWWEKTENDILLASEWFWVQIGSSVSHLKFLFNCGWGQTSIVVKPRVDSGHGLIDCYYLVLFRLIVFIWCCSLLPSRFTVLESYATGWV